MSKVKFFLLVAIPTAACFAIYYRKKRQSQKVTEELEKLEDGLRKIEAERSRLEKEKQLKVAQEKLKEEESKKQKKEKQKTTGEDVSIEPGKRGGAPKGTIKDLGKEKTSEFKTLQSKPEIVCWQRERQWRLGIEVPEDFVEKSNLMVIQNNLSLNKDEFKNDCCCLNQVCGQAMVQWCEGADTKGIEVTLGDENYLLFKLGREDKEGGRCVKNLSSGSYFAIVPDSWTRDEILSGSPSADPEPVSVEGFQGHFFDLGKGTDKCIAFVTAEGEKISIEPKAERFELVGKQLKDDSEGIGPLFGERPPKIRDLYNPAWKDIGTIVVGEEGRGKGKWRIQFSPEPDKVEQDLPFEVLDRKVGWYFLRFYDKNDDLIESVDFRFLAALKDIKVYPYSSLPGQDGHAQVLLEFIHESNAKVLPAKKSAKDLQIKPENGKTSVIIAPNPSWDLTYWKVESSPSIKMTVEILIERIWWGMGEEGEPLPQTWLDRPIPTSYDFFSATSKKTVYLWFPKRGWIQSIRVGFNKQRTRIFPVRVNERMVPIYLREFCDAQEICSRMQQTFLRVWFDRNGATDAEISICEILPEKEIVQVPPIPLISEVPPDQMRCCSTCDHAKRKRSEVWECHVVWCRRVHWERVLQDTFDEYYARFICGEWQGEYRDKEGNWQ